MKIRKVMKDIRNGKMYINGFLEISLYNKERNTYLVDSFYNGTSKREELSVYTVRKILNDLEKGGKL